MKDKFTLYLGLALIVIGQVSQALHHFRWALVDDSTAETFGAILVIGILVQLVALTSDV